MYLSDCGQRGWGIVLLTVVLVRASAFGGFTPGDMYYAGGNPPVPGSQIYNITGGGDLRGASPFSVDPDNDIVYQMAWCPDLSMMYYTAPWGNEVYAVSPSGVASVYATFSPFSNRPIGILYTQDNRLLVSSYDGNVYDISDPSHQHVFATPGTYGTMVQLPSGQILLTDASHLRVWDISGPTPVRYADWGPSEGSPFNGLSDIDYTSNGHVFVTSQSGVWEITGPSSATPLSGFGPAGLAIDRSTDHIFVWDGGNAVWDVTHGDPFDPWAYNIPAYGGALDIVPAAWVPVPLPGAVLLGLLGLGSAGVWLRRHAA